METRWWSVYVEYAAHVPDVTHDTAADHLADYSAALSAAPNGNFSVHLSVEAPTVERAQARALEATDRALQAAYGRAPVVGIEVMTEEERDRRNNEPLPIPELAGVAEIQSILGLPSRQRAGQITQTAIFQKYAQPVARLAAGPVFFDYQVRNYQKAREKKPSRSPKGT